MSLIEILAYVALFSVLSTILIAGIVTSARTFFVVRAERAVITSGNTALDAITNTIRFGERIDTTPSLFDVSPGRVGVVNRLDNLTTETVEIRAESGRLAVYRNGVSEGFVTPASVVVQSFIVRRLLSGTREGIRVELALCDVRNYVSSSNFYTTITLRGTY